MTKQIPLITKPAWSAATPRLVDWANCRYPTRNFWCGPMYDVNANQTQLNRLRDRESEMDQLSAELRTMCRLHELSTRLLATTELQPLLEEILDATMELLQGDFGNIQLYDPDSEALQIVAQRGFNQQFLDYFANVREESAVCGRALRQCGRVIIHDVNTDPAFAPHRKIAAVAGFRAVQSTPFFSRGGEPLGIISTHFRHPHTPSEHELHFLDLSAHFAAEFIERQRMAEALRASENRFRRYFDLGLIGRAITSPTKGILEVNHELCRILGYEREELLQMNWEEITHPDDIAADLEQFSRVMTGEIDNYTVEKRLIRKDGQIIHSIITANCGRRPDGSVEYLVGLVQDISERVQAEERVRKAHERVDMLLESISDNFFGLDKEGRFIYFNKHAAEQIRSLGKDPEALIGKVAWEEFPDMLNYDNVIRVLTERVVVVDELFYEPLGEWVENHMYPGTDGGLVTFQRYVTERKRTEEELRKAQAKLAHVGRLTTVGELTASIAHEVNQPLGAIVTNGHACLRLLSRENPDIDEARQAVECMIADGIRASEVIKRIRGLLRKSSGGKSSHKINDIIREVMGLTAGELSKHGIHVRMRLASGLPCVVADRVQIQQVVLNLIINSKEAMSMDDWQPRDLMICSEQMGHDIMLTIADSGIGIAPENQSRAFEPFFTSKEGGLGLGLSISRTIIDAHGGKLWTTPRRNGQGAVFQFTLHTVGSV